MCEGFREVIVKKKFLLQRLWGLMEKKHYFYVEP